MHSCPPGNSPRSCSQDKTQLDKQDCEQRFKEVIEAYEVLSDARKKAAYDRWGDAGVSGTHTAFFATAFSASPGDTPSAKRPHPCPASSAFAGFAACSSAFQHNFQQEFFSTFSDMFSGDAPQAGQPCAPGGPFPGEAVGGACSAAGGGGSPRRPRR